MSPGVCAGQSNVAGVTAASRRTWGSAQLSVCVTGAFVLAARRDAGRAAERPERAPRHVTNTGGGARGSCWLVAARVAADAVRVAAVLVVHHAEGRANREIQ